MFRAILGVALAVVPASLAVGQGGVPKGPPPKVMAVKVTDGKSFLVVRTTRMVEVQVLVQVQVGKRIENRLQKRLVPEMAELHIPLDGRKVRVFDVTGKLLDLKDIPKRLTKSTPVLVSADGKEVDPFYLTLARAETLVIVAPELVDPAAGTPMPVPAPLPPPQPLPPPKLPAPGL